jgi:glutamine synthetase
MISALEQFLKRVIQKGKEMGFEVKLGFEYEFFVFDENPHSASEKGYQNLKPITPGSFGYSIIRLSSLSSLFNEFTDYMKSLGITLESIHCETGPGAWEAAIKYDYSLRAADDAEIFKTFSKVFFEKRDLMATFMAKFSMEEMGLGGHVHHSLYDVKTHKPLFHDPNSKSEGKMSEQMKHFVAGQLKYMKELLAMCAPNINSYTRLTRGAWAPTSASWSIDNRTAAVRVIPGSEKSQRIEYRIPGADSNPYLVAAVIIASGLQGITEKLELQEQDKGNIYEAQKNFPEERLLSSCLKDSNKIFSNSKMAKEWFGEKFVEHYTKSREWEIREYERNINDWQLKRYFEII